MNFVWDMEENTWDGFRNHPEDFDLDNFLGNCRTGELCIDIVLYDWNELLWGYDVYVGGINSGYGYSSRESKTPYPYDYADGGEFPVELFNCSFAEFKTKAEQIFTEYIERDETLIAKANEPLHLW